MNTMKMDVTSRAEGKLVRAWTAEARYDRLLPGATPPAGDRFAPCDPDNVPILQHLQQSSRLEGLSGGVPLAKSLETRSIEISSALFGGPVGHVLHLSAHNGVFHADFRRPGDAASAVPLPSREKPSCNCNDAEFGLGDGRRLTVYQSPIDGFDDVTVGVTHEADQMKASMTWKGDGQPEQVNLYRYANAVALRCGGKEVYLTQAAAQEKCGRIAATAKGPSYYPPAEIRSDCRGNDPVPYLMPSWPRSAVGGEVRHLLESCDGLLADLAERNPGLLEP